MPEDLDYDVIVIGGGPGGYTAAIRASQLGLACALIEKDATFGGTCLNIGCIPAKSLLDSTELYYSIAEKAQDHGISYENLTIDLAAVMRKKMEAVEKLTTGVALLLKQSGVMTIRGTGKLAGGHSVLVTTAEGDELTMTGKNIILATGSRPADLPELPFNGKTIVRSDEALSFDSIPERLVVIGGGAVGLELGSVWMRLGTKVTVVEVADQILPGTDPRAARTLQQVLKKQGMDFSLATEIRSFSTAKGVVTVKGVSKKAGDVSFSGDRVLVAVGRKAVVEGLGLEEAGIRTTDRGKVWVDVKHRTSLPHVYAIGDITEGPMLAHRASEDGIAAAENIVGRAGSVNYETIPAVVYTWPEVATVGRSEARCEEEGIPVTAGMFHFRINGRAITSGNVDGFVKIIAHRDTDRVLGGVVVGPWASDLISEIVTVMEFGGSSEDIARITHAHPTFSEAVKEAAMDVEGRAIHFSSVKKVSRSGDDN